jgi:hypothetical protein
MKNSRARRGGARLRRAKGGARIVPNPQRVIRQKRDRKMPRCQVWRERCELGQLALRRRGQKQFHSRIRRVPKTAHRTSGTTGHHHGCRSPRSRPRVNPPGTIVAGVGVVVETTDGVMFLVFIGRLYHPTRHCARWSAFSSNLVRRHHRLLLLSGASPGGRRTSCGLNISVE